MHHAERVEPGAVEVAVVDHPAQLGQQRLPEPVDVEQRRRLGVQAEHAPGPGLEQLLERARGAGQRDEGVGEVGHHAPCARASTATTSSRGRPGVRQLVVHQVLRDDADDLAAGGQRGVGDDAHQPDVAAAVDDADAGLGQVGGEGRGRRAVGRRAVVRPGEDGDAHACSAAVVAVDRLGDADRLVAALALDDGGRVSCRPPATSSTSLSVAVSRTFEPTGTGEGKRTLFSP